MHPQPHHCLGQHFYQEQDSCCQSLGCRHTSPLVEASVAGEAALLESSFRTTRGFQASLLWRPRYDGVINPAVIFVPTITTSTPITSGRGWKYTISLLWGRRTADNPPPLSPYCDRQHVLLRRGRHCQHDPLQDGRRIAARDKFCHREGQRVITTSSSHRRQPRGQWSH